jgi:hypothetical protein
LFFYLAQTPLQNFDYSESDGTAFYAPPILNIEEEQKSDNAHAHNITDEEPQQQQV